MTAREETTVRATPDRARRLRITEIFHSIQGESSHAGRPSYFVRLTGCNLRCTWCDSEYTFQGGEWMGFDEIFAQLDVFPRCGLLEVTGGEPMLQPNVIAFMQECLGRGLEVMIETGGSLDLSDVPPEVRKIVDLKAPGSGEHERNLWENLTVLQAWDEIKIVVSDRADYEWAVETCNREGLLDRHIVHFSPVLGPFWQVTSRWAADPGAVLGQPPSSSLTLGHHSSPGQIPGSGRIDC